MTAGLSEDDPVSALVARIQQRTDYERGCEELYWLFQHRIRRFFAARGFSSEECSELTQQTFIRVFNGIGDFHFGSRFERWLFEIAANTYRNELRHRGAAKRDAPEESIEGLVQSYGTGRSDALPVLRSDAPSPLDDAIDRERLENLRAALEHLPPQMRCCVLLRLYQDLKYREIATLMKMSIETVKAHLHQARERLKLTLPDSPDDREIEGAL